MNNFRLSDFKGSFHAFYTQTDLFVHGNEIYTSFKANEWCTQIDEMIHGDGTIGSTLTIDYQ